MGSIKNTNKDKEKEKTVENEVKEKAFITKDDFASFKHEMLTIVTDLFKKQTEANTDTIGKDSIIDSQELGKDYRGIEPVSAHDIISQAELEKFMNDVVTIYVHPSPNKEDNPVIVPNVNGINQPIIRGKECKVKRKYIEALARNRTTRYEQKIPNPAEPHKYVMQPDTVVKDPFTVIHDPHPRGHEWLQAILAERYIV